MPENRYASDGWFCQKAIMLRRRSRPAQQRTVGHGGRAEHDVAAAAGGQVAAVIGELAGDQAVLVRFVGEDFVDGFELVPVGRGGQVHFEHARGPG